ncbi:MAG: glycosyltransferase family 2 protein [Nannocystales bacterium]
MSTSRTCALIPSYNNPQTVGEVVRRVGEHLETVVVVDDGSEDANRRVLEDLERSGAITLVRRDRNGGKGAAVKTGLAKVAELGFTHALQVDADLQHNLDDIPKFLGASQDQPDALVLGYPVFDDTRPAGREFGHAFTAFWTRLEIGSDAIKDPQCGFRVYPVAAATSVRVPSNRMDYDLEVCVRMVWYGCSVVNIPTAVRYLTADEGGISHFRMVRDNALITWMHTRLVILGMWLRFVSLFRPKATA